MVYLGILLFVAFVVLVTWTTGEGISVWWNRQIQQYASWMAIEFDSMFEEMSTARAQRIITWTIAVAFFLGLLAGGNVVSRIVLAVIFAAFGFFLPRMLVAWLRFRRLNTIDDQLVDALLLMSNALKAGLSLQQALELVVREMKPPICDEFGRVVKEIHLGLLTDDALRHLRDRVPLEDMRLAIESILTLRETGGNLSETFEVIAKTIVERKKVQGKIKALTAQGMAQGILICLMPPGMMVLFSVMSPSYMAPMYSTPLGWAMLATVFVLDSVGLYMMFKLVQVDV